MKIIYLANTRLPSEKAHGYQIVKMCEAWGAMAQQVGLWFPWRQQSPEMLKEKFHDDVFQYYGVKSNFNIKKLANFDILFLEKFLWPKIFLIVANIHDFIFWFITVQRVKKEKADIYYTRDLAIIFWLLIMGLRSVYEEHQFLNSRIALFFRIFKGFSSWKLVTVTAFIKEAFIKIGFPEHRIIVAPDAMDLQFFDKNLTTDDCRRRLKLPQNKLIVGYIGRFWALGREKGIANLTKAFSRLLPEMKNKIFLLCVGGPEHLIDNYVKLAKSLGLSREDFIFLGHQPLAEVPYWIKACDVATIPWPRTEFSSYATSPLKLFEYMAAGVPIVASDLPALKEIIDHGQNGWLVQPDDIGTLARGIKKILEDQVLAAKLATNAKRMVIDYTWQNRAKKILEYAHNFN